MLNKEKALVDESLNIFSNDIVTQHKKKLGKDPAFLMYSNDFLSNTAGLTLEEKGIYITLVCLLHQQGHLSMKTIWLHFGFNNICKLEDFDINNYFSRDLLENFRFDKNGKLYAIYFEQIFEERAKFVASRQINGRKGGRPQKIKKEPNGYPNNNLLEDEDESKNISADANLNQQ